jgi:hypothetical protein
MSKQPDKVGLVMLDAIEIIKRDGHYWGQSSPYSAHRKCLFLAIEASRQPRSVRTDALNRLIEHIGGGGIGSILRWNDRHTTEEAFALLRQCAYPEEIKDAATENVKQRQLEDA